MARKPSASSSNAPLSEIIAALEGGVSVRSGDRAARSGEVGVLKVSAVQDGRFRPGENKVVVGSEVDRLAVPARRGDLLISRANTPELVGACGLVREEVDGLYLPDKLWRIHVRDSARDSIEWLNVVLNSPAVRVQLRARASGTGRAMKNISKPALLGISVPRPPLAEQRRIVEILDGFVRAEAVLHRSIVAARRRLEGLSQQMLTGRLRLPSCAGKAWPSSQLGAFVRESRVIGSHGGNARKLTVRLYGRGVVEKAETKSGSEATQYYRRAAGQFIYSKLDFANGAFGVLPAKLDGLESTLDLPAFDVLPTADARWLLRFCARPGFYRRHARLANGGRKARRVNPDDFLAISEPVPPLAEQRAIADVLDTAQREVDLLVALRQQIERQKRGLMHQLLTGRIPIPQVATTAEVSA